MITSLTKTFFLFNQKFNFRHKYKMDYIMPYYIEMQIIFNFLNLEAATSLLCRKTDYISSAAHSLSAFNWRTSSVRTICGLAFPPAERIT